MSEEKHNEKDILTEKLLETRTVIITGEINDKVALAVTTG